jgi:uncharacterized protein YndB with AHSA1/START domain
MTATDAFRTSIDIEAPPEQVFDYFVRPELLVRPPVSKIRKLERHRVSAPHDCRYSQGENDAEVLVPAAKSGCQ